MELDRAHSNTGTDGLQDEGEFLNATRLSSQPSL